MEFMATGVEKKEGDLFVEFSLVELEERLEMVAGFWPDPDDRPCCYGGG